jgi:VWFA-related protein
MNTDSYHWNESRLVSFLCFCCKATAPGLLLFSTLLLAQAPPPRDSRAQEPRIPRIVVNVEKVLVPVTVKNTKGQLVNDLKKTDFTIYEDGVVQEISDFSTDPRALSAVLLVDTGMSTRAERQLDQTLRSLTESFSNFDELAVYTFEDRVEPLAAFGDDRDAAYKKLKRKVEVSGTDTSVAGGPIFSGSVPSINGRRMDVGPPPNYASLKPATKRVTDAIFFAALALKNRPRDLRKIILIVSDGNNTGKNENSYDETLRLMLDNNIALYGISDDQLPLLHHADIRDVLPKFANDTGGAMFFSFRREALENIYPVLTEQVRNQYELTYSPKRHTADSMFKSIEVRVNRPDLKVTARQGYYAVSVGTPTPPEKP